MSSCAVRPSAHAPLVQQPAAHRQGGPLTDGVLPVALAKLPGEDLHVARQHNQVDVQLLRGKEGGRNQGGITLEHQLVREACT